MKLFKSLKNCLTVGLLLAMPLFSLAQYKFPRSRFSSYLRDPSRYEIGVNGVIVNGTFDGVTRITGYNGQFIADSTLKRNIKANPGIGVTLGVNVPIAASGHISVWALNINAIANFYSWSALNQSKSLEGTWTTPTNNELTASSIQVALPVGIDWKVGADAIHSQRLIWGASLGAGAMPHINITTLEPSSVNDLVPSQQNIGVNPYVKAEGALYMRTCFKVRVLYTMGNVELFNTHDRIPSYNDGPFKLYNRNTLMLSLIWMPFSSRWGEYGWHNTYDSYNWNEKLN